MKFFLTILLLILSISLHAQIPKAENAYDNDGMKHGKWIYILDYQFKHLADTAKPAFFREIIYEHNKIVYPSRDFYINGNLQWEGLFTQIFPDVTEGKYTSYFPDKSIYHKGLYKEGKRDSLLTVYYKNGKINQTSYYKKGIVNGTANTFYENGNLWNKIHYLDGKVHGEYNVYFENGNILSTYNYNNGLIEGTFIHYHENGAVRLIGEYKGVNRKGTITQFYENGNIESIRNVQNDTLHGSYTNYYESGQLLSQYYYKMSLQDSTEIFYYENGHVKIEGQYNTDERDGKWTWYSNNGAVENVVFYDRGEEKSFAHFFQKDINKLDKKGEKTGLWIYPFGTDWKITTDTTNVLAFRNVTYKNGKPIGISKDYNRMGQIVTEMDLTSVEPFYVDSYIQSYDSLGNVEYTQKFNDDGSQFYFGFYPNGTVSESIPYDAEKRLHGEVKYYYQDGSLKESVNYDKDKKIGKRTEYFQNGDSKLVRYYSNDIKHGWEIKYAKNGVRLSGIIYVNGEPTIGGASYYDDNKLKETITPNDEGILIKTNYNEFEKEISKGALDSDENKHGLWKYFDYNLGVYYNRKYDQGKSVPTLLQFEIPQSPNKILNGQKEGLWTVYFNEKNEIEEALTHASSYAIGEFKEGKFYGYWSFYSIEGVLGVKGQLKSIDPHAKYDGEYMRYHENGKIFQNLYYVNDIEHGEYKEYNEDGILVEERIYDKGEVQTTRTYREGGNILAEGASLNGFKHGKWIWYKDGGKVDYWKFYFEGNTLDGSLNEYSWEELYNAGIENDGIEEYSRAVEQLRFSLLKIPQKDSSSIQVLKSKFHLGLAHGHKGDADEAYDNLKFVTDRIEIIKDNEWKLKVHQNFSKLLKYLKRYREASEQNKIAIKITKSNGMGEEVVMDALSELSYSLWIAGNSKEALPYALEASIIAEQKHQPTSEKYFTVINRLGNIYISLNQNKEAYELYEILLTSYDEILATNEWTNQQESNVRTIYSNHALAASNYNKYKEAESDYMFLYDLYRENYSYEERYFTMLNNFGTFYLKQDRYYKALFYLQKGHQWIIDNNKTDSWDYALINRNLGAIYSSVGQYDLADIHLKSALDYTLVNFGEVNENYINVLGGYGNFQYDKKSYTDADSIYTKVVRLQYELDSEHLNYILYKSSLATTKTKLGQLDDSYEILTQNVALLRTKFPDEHNYLAYNLFRLGLVAYEKNEMNSYVQLLEESCNELVKENKKDNLELTFRELSYAEALWRSGNMEKSFDYYKDASKKYLKYFVKELSHLPKIERELFYEKNDERLQKITSIYEQKISDNSELTGDFYNHWLTTHGLFNSTEVVNNYNYSQLNNANDIDTYFKFINTHKKIISISNPSFEIDDIELAKLKSQASILETKLIQSVDSAKQKEVTEINWKDIQKNLKDGEAAIEIVNFKHYNGVLTDSIIYGAFILKSTGKPIYVSIPNFHVLENTQFKLLSTYMKYAMTDKKSYDWYWKNIDKNLEGIDKISVASNGVFHKINLNAIYNPIKEKYLIDLYQISYLTSTSELINSNRAENSLDDNQQLVAVGNPIFDLKFEELNSDQSSDYTNSIEKLNTLKTRKAGKNKISSLPGTASETNLIKSISLTYNINVNLHQKHDASESNVKSTNAPSILHIATHGFFSPDTDNPDYQAGLLFSGAQDMLNYREAFPLHVEDGILFAGEAKYMDLSRTRLLTLSACETGLGTIEPGKALSGLQQSFFVAGVDNIIVSLWKVDDLATQKLMSSFYEQLFIIKDIDKAFRNAQRITREEYPHPKYWGAFKLISSYSSKG